MDSAAEASDIPAPASADEPHRPGRPRIRATIYCLLLAGLASVLMFRELGVSALASDESQYAAVVQTICETGEWFDVTPYPPTTYFQKPPLYFWLSASTYDALGGGEFACRAWSAAAGVGAVVLTCVLGALLFTPEIGAFGGLLLLLNRSFVLVHGARSGTFDALVTFLLLAAVVAYVLGGSSGKRRWIAWVMIGVFAGLASSAKPFIGVPLVVLLAVHALFARRDVLGPLVALVVLVAAASPWYLVEWHRHGDKFVDQMFRQNIVQRITAGVDDQHIQDPKFYADQITKSSPAFWFGVPAMLYVLVRMFRRPNRQAYGLLACVGVGWVVLFTLSESKAVHYAYPAFPLIALMIVDGAAAAFRALSTKWSDAGRHRFRFAAYVMLAFVMTLNYAYLLLSSIPGSLAPHVPWEMYKVFEPAVRAGEVRVVFCGFPELEVRWREENYLGARDCYYLQQMHADVRTQSVDEVARLIADGTPTLLVLARNADVDRFLATPELSSRVDSRFVYAHQDFHFAGVNVQTLLDPPDGKRVTPLTPGKSPGEYTFSLTRPALGSTRIAVRLRLPESAPAEVKYTFAMVDPESGKRKRLDARLARHRGGVLEVSDFFEEGLWPDTRDRDVTLKFQYTGSRASEPVSSSVESVRMTVIPRVPEDTHPRR